MSTAWLRGFLRHTALFREQLPRLLLLFLLLLKLPVVLALVMRLSPLCWMLLLHAGSAPPLMPPQRIAVSAAAVLWQCEPPFSWCCLYP